MAKRATLVALVVFMATVSPANAAGPMTLSYQGYVTDSSGAAIDTDTSIEFAIYNMEVSGSPLWTDTQTVAVDNGLFSVVLGGPANPFPADLFETPVWIGVAVAGDSEMLPRRAVASAAYSIEADNAVTLQGIGPAALDQSAHTIDTANPHQVTAMQAGAATPADVANLQSQFDAALATIATLQATLDATVAQVGGLQVSVDANTAGVAANDAAITAEAGTRQAGDDALTAALAGVQANSVLSLDGVLSLSNGDTALFEGVNVQVVNGTGTTDGEPNGLGNVVVGYNTVDVPEATSDLASCSLGAYDEQVDCESNGGVWAQSHKSGSHNVVVGDQHNYSRFGGLVAGRDNSITGDWTSVTAGEFNAARGKHAGVSGGRSNRATGDYSSVLGGGGLNSSDGNEAQGNSSAILGGWSNFAGDANNSAFATGATITGGLFNTASGTYASVTGGIHNDASGDLSVVVGGGNFSSVDGNNAYARYSVVVGGRRNVAGDTSGSDFLAQSTVVLGGSDNVATAELATVVGGQFNEATGDHASVAGGQNNEASGLFSAVSGGTGNTASGFQSAVGGGQDNVASGSEASVGGGARNTASGNNAWGGGGLDNVASGENASVSGGQENVAFGTESSVSGGALNIADGNNATVSGGLSRSASGDNDWRAGGLFETE